MSKRHYCLIGYRGSGKSTIFRRVRKICQEKGFSGLEFVSIDEMVERKLGRLISEVVAEKGWEVFRDMESHCLREVLASPTPAFIDAGGGIVEREENRKLLKEKCYCIYLNLNATKLLENQKKSPRPSLASPPSKESMPGESKSSKPSLQIGTRIFTRSLKASDQLKENDPDTILLEMSNNLYRRRPLYEDCASLTFEDKSIAEVTGAICDKIKEDFGADLQVP